MEIGSGPALYVVTNDLILSQFVSLYFCPP